VERIANNLITKDFGNQERSLEIERTAHSQRNYNTARSSDDGPPAMTRSPDTAIAS